MAIQSWRHYNPARRENSKGEILLSREFLEACLEERASQENPIVLDARQRKFLELVARAATFGDEIAVPKELLEAFLAGAQEKRWLWRALRSPPTLKKH
jgi:hypothetical protein